MIKEIIIVPAIVLFILGFVLQITAIAESASAKVLDFTSDMDNAVECALNGVSIYNCSPNLGQYEFEKDIVEYQYVNKEYLERIVSEIENAAAENKTIRIVVE